MASKKAKTSCPSARIHRNAQLPAEEQISRREIMLAGVERFARARGGWAAATWLVSIKIFFGSEKMFFDGRPRRPPVRVFRRNKAA